MAIAAAPPRFTVAVQLSDRDRPARKTRARRKADMFERLKALPRRIGASQPDDAVHQIALLMDGAVSSDRSLSSVGASRILHSGARVPLDGTRVADAPWRAPTTSRGHRTAVRGGTLQ